MTKKLSLTESDLSLEGYRGCPQCHLKNHIFDRLFFPGGDQRCGSQLTNNSHITKGHFGLEAGSNQ